jgi:hypothetical protein
MEIRQNCNPSQTCLYLIFLSTRWFWAAFFVATLSIHVESSDTELVKLEETPGSIMQVLARSSSVSDLSTFDHAAALLVLLALTYSTVN